MRVSSAKKEVLALPSSRRRPSGGVGGSRAQSRAAQLTVHPAQQGRERVGGEAGGGAGTDALALVKPGSRAGVVGRAQVAAH